MPLAGAGAICIWNDITAEGRDEFYAWHIREHMPERAAIPGFRRGRRFIAADAATNPEFFTLYETDDAAVLTGTAYLARLNDPTPWTKRATQAFRNTSRALTEVLCSFGPGDGGALATLRLPVRHGQEDGCIQRMRELLLPAAVAADRIAGAHFCGTLREASSARTAESRERNDILAAPDWVALVEACDVEAAAAVAAQLHDGIADLLSAPPAIGIYRFEAGCR